MSQCVQSHPTTLQLTCAHHSLVLGADHQSVDQSGPCWNHLEHYSEPVCSVSPNYSSLLVLTLVLFLVLIINLLINQGHVGTILNIIVSQCVQSHPTTLQLTCTHHSLVLGADHQSVDQSGPCWIHLKHYSEPVCSVSPNYLLLYLYSR